MFEGSCYKEAPSGLAAWVTPNMWPLTGKPGQELRAVVGGSFPSSTVPRSGKHQNTEKVSDWGVRESCNRIICVFASLSLFRSLLSLGPFHWEFCAVVGLAVQADDTVLMYSLPALFLTLHILSPSKPLPKPGVCSLLAHDSSCFVNPQHGTHWPVLTTKTKTGTKRGNDASYSGLPVDYLHTGFHFGLESSYPPPLLWTPVF